MKSDVPPSVAVIGAGIGGIAAAARLARAGYAVSVFEKSPHPGGRTSVVSGQGFRFDAGPTLFLMPAVFAETYAALGSRMEDHLDLVRIDPTYRIHFHDGSVLDLTSDLIAMRAQLEALEPGAFAAYLRFMAEGYRHYTLSLQHFVGRDFNSLLDYFSLRNLPLLFQLKALTRHADNTARYFKDPRLQAAFSFQNMYLGLSPFDAPATFSLLQYTELGEGVWFPRGGLFRVIESLTEIARQQGVQFHFSAPVAEIIIRDGRAAGVRLASGEQIAADIVLANADLPYVYASLLPNDAESARLGGKKYTSSALMFYWGLEGGQTPGLLHHNVFLADHRYRESFETIFRDHSLPAEPSFYINAPSRTQPDFAPAGSDGLMVLVPVGHNDAQQPQDWPALEQRARQAVLQRLAERGFGDIAGRIRFEVRWGPPYYQNHLNLANGAAFGLSHNFLQVGYLRPHNRHPRYANLYFAGASTHPGTGLPIVLLSARLTSERVLREFPLRRAAQPASSRYAMRVAGK